MRSVFCLLTLAAALWTADWPEWRGAGRQGLWTESRILSRFPSAGLKAVWRVPVRPGYAGPAVADGRIYLLDHQRHAGTRATERVLCLDEKSGRELWSRSWDADYRGLDYANGPRATPTVDGDRVYVLGAMGSLRCLRTRDGAELWSVDFVRDLEATVPGWGMSSAPMVTGGKVIAVAAGKGNAKVVAFDKHTGKVAWRALSSTSSEPGYSQPILIHNPQPQLIVWHTTAIDALNPENGEHLWTHPFRITMNTPIMTPAWSAPHLLVSGFFNGARLLDLTKPTAPRLLWSSNPGSNEIRSDKLHALMSQPLFDGDYIYGVSSYGQLRCLRRSTGEVVWETQQATVEKTRNVSAWLVRHREFGNTKSGNTWICNDRGELIISRLSPEGYRELSRTKVIRPTSTPGARREFNAVVWSHPAFANRHLLIRNDEELVRYSLDQSDYPSR
jgi:outer membrane protein assembly factor BamB